MLGFIVEKIAEMIAGRPDGPRWAYVTALFGWAAGLALVGGIGATVLGATALASKLVGLFSFCLVIAMSLDWTRFRR